MYAVASGFEFCVYIVFKGVSFCFSSRVRLPAHWYIIVNKNFSLKKDGRVDCKNVLCPKFYASLCNLCSFGFVVNFRTIELWYRRFHFIEGTDQDFKSLASFTLPWPQNSCSLCSAGWTRPEDIEQGKRKLEKLTIAVFYCSFHPDSFSTQFFSPVNKGAKSGRS